MSTNAITKAMRAADLGHEKDRAELIATLINADMALRQGLTGSTSFSGSDVQRLSRIMGEYNLHEGASSLKGAKVNEPWMSPSKIAPPAGATA